MRLCVFGDSFVAGIGDSDHRGWIGRAVAGTGRTDISLYNLGIRGQTGGEIADRLTAEAAPRLPPGLPAGVILSFGANDCAAGPDGAPRRSLEQSLQDLNRALTAASALAPVLMIGPAPIADDPAADARIAALCPRLQDACAARDVGYIPVHYHLRAAPVWIDEALAGDGAHPGAAGYRHMAELVSAHPQWRRFFLIP